ncbi:MAG: dihydropteroate synthase [Pseudomonadota bacterium]
MHTYYRPIPILDPAPMDSALRLAGGWCVFNQIECLTRDAPPRIIDARDAPDGVIDKLTARRPPIAGLTWDRPRVMGILNATPDSFSDGGAYADADAAIARAWNMQHSGADILDIGGESTRPGAQEVPSATEQARVVPLIEALRRAGLTLPLSIDTRKADVAAAALNAGADIINDVSGLRFDPHLAGLAADRGAPVVLMHSVETPATMQSAARYDDVLLDVYDALSQALDQAAAAGIPRGALLIDPGIGFGKTDAHNTALLARLSLLHMLGAPLLLGVSRKGFIGRIADIPHAPDRDAASAALGLWAISQGVQVLRVHDILVHKQMIALWQRIGATGHEE